MSSSSISRPSVDIPPADILSGALAANLDSVMVIGWDGGGDLYVASSTGDAAELILLLELAKRATLRLVE